MNVQRARDHMMTAGVDHLRTLPRLEIRAKCGNLFARDPNVTRERPGRSHDVPTFHYGVKFHPFS